MRALVVVAIWLLLPCALPGAASAAPPNDDFANALPIYGDDLHLMAEIGTATEEINEPKELVYIANWSYPSVWYRWTPATNHSIAVESLGGQRGTDDISLFRGATLDTLVRERSTTNYHGTNGATEYVYAVQAGVEYYVRAHRAKSPTSEIARWRSIRLAKTERFADDFEDSGLSLLDNWTSSSEDQFWFDGATRQPSEPDHAGAGAGTGSRWTRLVVPPAGMPEVTISSTGSEVDTTLAVYTGDDLDDLTLLAANDDAFPGSGYSTLRFTPPPGEVVHLAVASPTPGATGRVRLAYGIKSADGDDIVNDDFADRYVLNDLMSSGGYRYFPASTYTGTSPLEPDEPPLPAGMLGSMWYSMTFDEPGAIIATSPNLGGCLSVAAVEVFTGSSLGSLVLVAATTPSTAPRLEVATAPGIEYVIRISSNRPHQTCGSLLQLATPTAAELASDPIERGTVLDADMLALVQDASWHFPPAARFAAYLYWAIGSMPENAEGYDETTMSIIRSYIGPLRPVHPDEPTNQPGVTRSRWITYVAEGTGTVTFQAATLGNSPTWIAAYEGSGFEDLTPLADATGPANDGIYHGLGTLEEWADPIHYVELSFPVQVGRTYFLRLGGDDDADSALLAKELLDGLASVPGHEGEQAPVNDRFTNAVDVLPTIPTMYGSTRFASYQGGEPVHGVESSGGRSIWYRWTAESDGPVTFDTRESSVRSRLAIYTGPSVSSLTLVARDDGGAEPGTNRVILNATAGTTYHIALDAVDREGGGDVQLNFNRAVPHDKFLAGRVLPGDRGAITGDTLLGSGRELGEPVHGGSTGGGSIWYWWTAPSSTLVTFDTSGSEVSTAIAAYTGSTVSTLVGIASSAPGPANGRIQFWATSGTTYRIAVSPTAANEVGDVVLRWRPSTNDRQADAQVIATAAATVNDNLGGAGIDPLEPAPCAGGPCRSTVWYQWTAPVTGVIRAATTSSAFDPGMSLLDATGSTILASNDDAAPGSTASRIHAAVTSGTTYLIRVESTSIISSGAFTLTVNVAPSNDAFSTASPQITTTWSGQWSGFSVGATAQAGEPAHAGTPATRSVWLRWTAPQSGTVTLDTVGSDFDTRLAVYTGTVVGSLTHVASNDDGIDVAPQSALSFAATSGTTYRIAVDGAGGAAGDVTVRINVPLNDSITEAIDVVDSGWGPIPLSTVGATVDVNEPTFQTGTEFSVWYRWTITTAGPRVLRAANANVSLMLFSGSTYETLEPVPGVVDDRTVVPPYGMNTGVRGVLQPGVYHVRAVTRTSAADTTLSAPVPPVHDDLAAPRIITGTGGPWLTEADAATQDPGEPHIVNALLKGNVPWSNTATYAGSTWFEWTATSTAAATFASSGTNDTVTVWQGGAQSLRDLRIVPMRTNGTATNVASIDAISGTTYLIRVTSATASGTSLKLNEPPANDNLTSAALLSNTTSSRAQTMNFGATCEGSEGPHAGMPCSGTIWYRWTPATSGIARITTWGSHVDTVAAIYTGTTYGTLAAVGGSSVGLPADPRAVEFDVPVVANTTYRIAVGSRGINQGLIKLQVGMAVPGDRITEAIPIAGDEAVLIGDTLGATTDAVDVDPYRCPNSSCLDPLRSASVWYEWTPSYDGLARIQLTGTNNTLGLMRDLSTRLEPIDRIESPTTPLPTYQTYEVEAGVTYYVGLTRPITGSVEPAGGPYTITLNVTPNDDFADARVLTKYRTFDVVTSGAGTEPGELNHGGAGDPRSIWYSWTATSTGPVSFTTARSGADTSLAAYVGSSIGTLALVAQDDDSITGDDAWIEFDAVAGTTYRIAVGVAGTAPGEVVLRRDVAPNDEPTHATQLTGSTISVAGTIWNGTWFDDEPGSDMSIANSSPTNWSYRAAGFTSSYSPHRFVLTWYRWTPPISSNVLLTTTDTTVDTFIRVLRETSPGEYEILAENDNYGGLRTSRTTYDAVSGEEVLIAVGQAYGSPTSYGLTDGYTEGEASYRLRLTQVPGNDAFEQPVPLSGWTASAVGSTLRATVQDGEPDHAGVHGGHSVWYSWTAPTTGPATVSTTDADFDTALAVYVGTDLHDLTEVRSSDDNGATLHSTVSFQASAGTTYRIALDGYRSASGVATVAMNVRPPNDDLANAFVIEGDVARASGISTNATLEPDEDDHAGAGVTGSVWWTWTPSTTGPVTIDTFGSDFDTVLAVYTGSTVNALTEVAANDDSGGTTSSVSFNAMAGITYRIAVAGANDAGEVEIRINPRAPQTPELVAPIGGAPTDSRSGPLQVRVHHDDAGVLVGAQVETCADAVAPPEPWSVNCTSGYVFGASPVTSSAGAVTSATLASKLTMGTTYHWRARSIDGAGVTSTWSAPDTLTVGGTISLTVTGLGSDATRRGSSVALTTALPGGSVSVGPSGSGQSTPGAAFEADLDAEIPAQLQVRAVEMTNWDGGTIPVSAMAWRDHDGGIGEAMPQIAWVPFSDAATVVELAPGTGLTRFEHDLRITLAADLPPGSYVGSVIYTAIAAP